jgi:hypothetical protein
MPKDIRFLLVFLIIALAALVWLQSQNCNAIPNEGALMDNAMMEEEQMPTMSSEEAEMRKMRRMKKQVAAKQSTAKMVDSILKTDKAAKIDQIMQQVGSADMSSQGSGFTNPIIQDVNNDRNSMSSDQAALQELIREVNTGNDLLIDSPQAKVYRDKARSIDAAPEGTYRKVSYKDSKYRYDFDNDGSPSQASQEELNSLYDDALVFRNNEYTQNTNFTGYSSGGQSYGDANLKDFTPKGKQSQQEKVMALYNSNEYLPNNDLLDNKLTKGFQILENPVAVSNPNLIPVLKSIPVSSVLGSKRNSTWDLRAEPPCPKTVVSPFLNSSIMPDIYATQRGCL